MASRQQEYGEIIEALANRLFASKPEKIADVTELRYDNVKMACEELTLTGYLLDKGGKFIVNYKNPHLAPIVRYARKTDQKREIPVMLADFFTAKDSPILKEVEAALEEAIHLEGLEQKDEEEALPAIEEQAESPEPEKEPEAEPEVPEEKETKSEEPEPVPEPEPEDVPEVPEPEPEPEPEEVPEAVPEPSEKEPEPPEEQQAPEQPEKPREESAVMSALLHPADTIKKKIEERQKEALERDIEEITKTTRKPEKPRKKDTMEIIGEDIKIFEGSNVTGKQWRDGAEDLLMRFVAFEELTVHGITYETPDDLKLNISTFTDHELEVILKKLKEYFED